MQLQKKGGERDLGCLDPPHCAEQIGAAIQRQKRKSLHRRLSNIESDD